MRSHNIALCTLYMLEMLHVKMFKKMKVCVLQNEEHTYLCGVEGRVIIIAGKQG